MYIPKYYKVTDMTKIREFIQNNSFGTLITTKQGKPIATHTPMLLGNKGEDYYITGHIAYGNPQWRTFDSNQDVLVIFQGPHSYISSSWYEHENVPTWNYQAVHVYGTARILSREELQQDLTMLLQKYESHRDHPVLWDTLSPEYLERELKGIVGFEIKINEVQAAFKLSQNRNDKDYSNIIENLMQEDDYNSKQMAEIMKENK